MSILAGLLTSAPQSHAPQLIDLDGTIFVQLGLFLALMLILKRFLWDPYVRVRGERVSRVEGYRETAAALEADAAARLTRTEGQLAEARRIGTGVRVTARAEAQAREQTVLAEATAAAQRTLAEARARLNVVLDAERAKLAARASEIGREAASKILRREVAR
ncbi:MAG TPA: ATP synthase F0 subunit B [Polyangia bacterium]|jgi:F-type H+-transporting ATPase subunit b|nr:ATP synthase F0 subunit B [Polyangia bacterium]